MTSPNRDVVLLPSLGRPASDFDRLGAALRTSGFMPHALDPSPSFDGEPTLLDLADDVRRTMDTLGIDSAHIIGHAFVQQGLQ